MGSSLTLNLHSLIRTIAFLCSTGLEMPEIECRFVTYGFLPIVWLNCILIFRGLESGVL